MSGSPRSAPSSPCARRLPNAHIYYRRRRKNSSRKAGNIADFVTRWGGHYPHMLVLDADSVMSGNAIVRLAAAMEADPDAGIIQSLPLIINRNTMFARVQQFAARIAGPVIAAGLSAWSGHDGNYWGHNAIIRTRAFADHCGLPDLPGQAAVRRPYPQSRLRRGGPDPPGRIFCVHAADSRRILRGKPAVADRPGRPRSPLVPGQPAALSHHRRQRLRVRDPPALRDGDNGLSRLAALDGAVADRHRASAPVALYPARILHHRLLAFSGVAAVRLRARASALCTDHSHPSRAEVPWHDSLRFSTGRRAGARAARLRSSPPPLSRSSYRPPLRRS